MDSTNIKSEEQIKLESKILKRKKIIKIFTISFSVFIAIFLVFGATFFNIFDTKTSTNNNSTTDKNTSEKNQNVLKDDGVKYFMYSDGKLIYFDKLSINTTDSNIKNKSFIYDINNKNDSSDIITILSNMIDVKLNNIFNITIDNKKTNIDFKSNKPMIQDFKLGNSSSFNYINTFSLSFNKEQILADSWNTHIVLPVINFDSLWDNISKNFIASLCRIEYQEIYKKELGRVFDSSDSVINVNLHDNIVTVSSSKYQTINFEYKIDSKSIVINRTK